MSEMTSSSRFHQFMRERGMIAKPGADAAPASALDAPLKVTFFRNHQASTKEEATTTLRGLLPRLRDTVAASKANLPWLKLATFGGARSPRGSLRNDGNVLEVHGIEADYDGEQITLDRARQIIAQAGIAAILYTSPSHTDAAPRWRILCPTSRPLPPADRAGLVARVNGLFVGALARESFTLSQSYYYGRVEGSDGHTVLAIDGQAIDHASALDAGAVGRPERPAPPSVPLTASPAPRRVTEGGTAWGLAALDDECAAIRQAGQGQKHDALNKAAFAIGGLVTGGDLQEGVAFSALSGALADIRHRCKDFAAAERTLRQAFHDGMGRPRETPERLEDAPLAPAVLTLTRIALEREAKRLGKTMPAPGPIPIAPGLMDVPGALRLFAEFCDRTAMSPQPFLSLAAGICLIGAVAGRKYRTTTDLRTNIYAVGVADSGGGKDHARKQIRRCLYAAGLPQYMGGSDIASGSGLRTALLRHPSMLFQIDEFGDWLAEVLGSKAAAHRKQIASMLKELYSSANTPWQGIEYADQSKQGRPREDIHQPNACLYGTTTPGQFWAAVAGASLHDGLMARILLFVSPCSYPDEREPDLAEPPEDLIAGLQAIAAGPEAHDGGNLGAIMSASTTPKPYTVPETPEASAARRELRQEQLRQQRKAEGTYITAIAGRLAENAMKLALVRAIARDPQRPVIGAEDVAWGRALSQHCIDTLLREASRHVAENEYEGKLNRAMEIIRKHGPLTQRDMLRRGFRMPERERSEILRTLIDSGMVVAVTSDPDAAGRPTIRYAMSEGVTE